MSSAGAELDLQRSNTTRLWIKYKVLYCDCRHMQVNSLQLHSKFKFDALIILSDRFWIWLKGLGLSSEADQRRVFLTDIISVSHLLF